MCVKQLSMSSLGDSQVTTDSLFANRHTALFEHGGTLCSHTWPLSTMLYCWAFTAFMLSLSLISAAICTAHTVHFTGFFSFFQQASSYRHGKAAFYPSLPRVTLVWWPPHCSSGSFATGPITRQNSHSDRNVHGDFVRLEYAYFQAICSANAHNIALLHKTHSNIVSKTQHTYCLKTHNIATISLGNVRFGPYICPVFYSGRHMGGRLVVCFRKKLCSRLLELAYCSVERQDGAWIS